MPVLPTLPANTRRPVPAWLQLDPVLDARVMAKAFSAFGRLHIPGVLTDAAAQRIYRSLAGDTPWARLFNRGDQVFRASITEWAALPPRERAELEAELFTTARDGFQFLYDSYNLDHAEAQGERLGVDCEAVLDFLNGPAFLRFVRELTGDARIASVDAQASRYGPGHFLTEHSDDQPGVERLFAYVLNFTPVWKVDWGGLLAFIDHDGHVAEAYTPRFNALNIFRVPQPHCVTVVAPFAGASRYAITGWIKA